MTTKQQVFDFIKSNNNNPRLAIKKFGLKRVETKVFKNGIAKVDYLLDDKEVIASVHEPTQTTKLNNSEA